MIKKCSNLNCEKEFSTEKKNNIYCSKECSKEWQWKDGRRIDKKHGVIHFLKENGDIMQYPMPTIIIDSREQNPYSFRSVGELAGVAVSGLKFGDYSIKDHTDLIFIERKNSALEFYGNLGKERERFSNELEKAKHCKFKFIIIEDKFSSLYSSSYLANKFSGNKYKHSSPRSILGSLSSFMLSFNINIIFSDNRENAQDLVRKLLLMAYRKKMEGNI